MRKAIVVLSAVLILGGSLGAAERAIRVTLEEPVMRAQRYAHIRGTVLGLRQDEEAVIEWRDALERLIAFRQVRRGKAEAVTFDFEIAFVSTTFNRILCRAKGRGEYAATVGEASLLTPLPPEPWEDYRMLLFPVMEERFEGYLPALADAGFQQILARRSESPELFLRQNVGYVVMSLLAAGSLQQGARQWEGLLRGYLENADPSKLTGPAPTARVMVKLKEEIASVISKRRYTRPAGYALGQGLSLTAGGRALDLSFSQESLVAFRAWLQRRYGAIAALNDAWGKRYSRWSDVLPEAMLDTVERCNRKGRRRRREPYNFAPWMEHRLFMDDTFTGMLEALCRHARDLDGDTPLGLMASVTPSPFGGIDYFRLSRSLDFLERDEAGVLGRLFRGRATPGPRIIDQFDIDATDFDTDLWQSVLSGDHGAVLLDDEVFFSEGGRISSAGSKALKTINAARAGWLRMLSLPHTSSRKVALYYSRPSLLAATILDVVSGADDAKQYIARWRPTQAAYLQNFLAWCDLLKDLGLDYEVVTAADWGERRFDERPYPVLVLPKLLVARNEDVQAVMRFAETGRPIIADNLTGVLDASGRERETSPLDALFGIERSIKQGFCSDVRGRLAAAVQGEVKRRRFDKRFADIAAGIDPQKLLIVEEGVTALREDHLWEIGKTDAVRIRETPARSLAVYLNLSMMAYTPQHRAGDQAKALRTLIGNLMTFLNVTPTVTVRRDGKTTGELAVFVHRVDELFFVGLVRRQAGAGRDEIEYQVQLPATGHVYNLTTRKYFGPVNRVLLKLAPGEPTLLAVFPYHVKKMLLDLDIDTRDSVLTYTAEVLPDGDGVRVGHHLFEVSLTDANGRNVVPKQTFVSYKGWAKRDIVLSRDLAPGRYRLSVFDLVTNARAQREFDVNVENE